MSPEQRKLTFDLLITPWAPRGNISKEEFRRSFPDAVRDEKLSAIILDQMHNDKDAEGLQCALIIGFVFGFSPEHEEVICKLVYEDWHSSHEDVVSAIQMGRFNSDTAIDALYTAAMVAPAYLAFDDARALAVKAVWALGAIPGKHSEALLMLLVNSLSSKVREAAKQQLDCRIHGY